MHTGIRAATAAFVLGVLGSLPAAASDGPYRRTVADVMASQAAAPQASAPRATPRARASDRRSLPGNPLSARAATSPHALRPIAPPTTSQPQTLGVTFLGASSDGTIYPPDTMGAAGPTQFLVGINGRIRSFSKATGTADGVLDADMDVFFASVRSGNPTATPRVRYDRLSSRWFVTITALTSTNNRILIAVSDAASAGVISASTVWTYFYFHHNLDAPAGDDTLFLDSASLGIDANGAVIGGNLFNAAGSFQGTSVHVARKSTLLTGAGGNLVVGGLVRAFRNLTGSPTGPGPYTPQGVDNLHDAAATDSWVAGVDNASFGTLVFRKIQFTATGAWPPGPISANLPVTVPATAFPLSVPHLGNALGAAGELDALDDRLSSASLRAGRIWTAHNVAVDAAGASPGDRDGSRWYEIDVSSGSPVLAQAGTLFDAAATSPRFYWIPAIAVSGQGHAAIGSSAAGAAEHINAVTAGRLAGDPAGSLQSPILFTASAADYNPIVLDSPRRWGDYAFTSVDPNDDMTMWTIQEFCNATDSWGVQAVELVAPPPATPSSASSPTVGAGLSSVLIVVTGTSTAGSGFFDPGPGFPGRLTVSVSGGVVVTGVTYTSPTSITLDLDTTGALLGPVTVTVTNPDGQSVASASGFLTIVGSGTPPTVTAIAPTSGPAAGGTAVVLSGTDFELGATVTIGGAAATGVTVTSASTADATTPALAPGALYDVTLANPSTQSGTLPAGWFADFLDVAQGDLFHDSVETLIRNAITAGCGGGNYCRNDPVSRGQMATLLLKSKLGSLYTPPPCTGTVFLDVPCTGGLFDAWIEDLAARGITGGCGGGNYCPGAPVTRAQMAALLLKTDFGGAYAPPPCTGTVFTDVPCTGGLFDAWIEDLAARGITGGCGGGNYCPASAVTRGQMAAFLVITFELN